MLRVLLSCLCVLFATSTMAKDVYYPSYAKGNGEMRFEYKVLKLALSKADGDWTLKRSPITFLGQERNLRYLEDGSEVQVGWLGTSPELEERLDPVFIPISGGLLGWRVMFIPEPMQPAFSEVQSIEDMQGFTLGQGIGWKDVRILEQAGLTVDQIEYDNLYPMVARGRIDAYPRGANEILHEMQTFGPDNPGLSIEQDLVLRYPFAFFYFVSPKHPDIRDAIEQGLRRAHADGSYQELFLSDPTIRYVLDTARLDQRRVIEIENPFMSDQVRAIEEDFWFDPRSATKVEAAVSQ